MNDSDLRACSCSTDMLQFAQEGKRWREMQQKGKVGVKFSLVSVIAFS